MLWHFMFCQFIGILVNIIVRCTKLLMSDKTNKMPEDISYFGFASIVYISLYNCSALTLLRCQYSRQTKNERKCSDLLLLERMFLLIQKYIKFLAMIAHYFIDHFDSYTLNTCWDSFSMWSSKSFRLFLHIHNKADSGCIQSNAMNR